MKTMKEVCFTIAVVVLSVPYMGAYGICKLFNIPGVEDMETIPEWFGMIKEYRMENMEQANG